MLSILLGAGKRIVHKAQERDNSDTVIAIIDITLAGIYSRNCWGVCWLVPGWDLKRKMSNLIRLKWVGRLFTN